jgi:hypothetical protein
MDPGLDAPLDVHCGGWRVDKEECDQRERGQSPEAHEDDEQISNDEAECRAEALGW